MTNILSPIVRALVAASVVATGAQSASAACTRLGFSVNDYGKEGPTNDAKSLLDKYIAKWAVEHKIAKYTTGKKDVSCELFLNFIVFDEHTCRAEATVCWDGPAVPGTGLEATAEGAPKQSPATPLKRVAAPVLPVKAKAAPDAAKSAIETGAIPVPAEPVAATAVVPAAAPAAVSAPPAPAVPEAIAPVAIPKPAPAAAAPVSPSSAQAIANQAMEAAKKAAESAERAAAAAERAAAAATAAAAAKKSTVLPPAQ